jgi:YbbR domain-containing protein
MSSLNGRNVLEKLANNWPAKVISIVVAIFLFMFHRMSALDERYFSIPLRVQTDGQLVPASSYPRNVRVTLRGESNTVLTIVEDDIEAYIDLTKYKNEGVYKAPVQIQKKGSALGINPLEIQVDPVEIALAIEKKESKVVGITPSFRGFLNNGYELSSYVMEPSQVEVSGPTSVVDKISDVTTDFIELTGRKENFTVSVKLLNKDPLIKIAGNGMVNFQAVVQPSVLVKTFDHLPIVISGLNQKFVARPQINFGSVKLQGSQNDLDVYTPDASLLSLDCSEITEEGTYMLPVIVSAPQNLSVIRYDPQDVPVEVAKAVDGVKRNSGGQP